MIENKNFSIVLLKLHFCGLFFRLLTYYRIVLITTYYVSVTFNLL